MPEVLLLLIAEAPADARGVQQREAQGVGGRMVPAVLAVVGDGGTGASGVGPSRSAAHWWAGTS